MGPSPRTIQLLSASSHGVLRDILFRGQGRCPDNAQMLHARLASTGMTWWGGGRRPLVVCHPAYFFLRCGSAVSRLRRRFPGYTCCGCICVPRQPSRRPGVSCRKRAGLRGSAVWQRSHENHLQCRIFKEAVTEDRPQCAARLQRRPNTC